MTFIGKTTYFVSASVRTHREVVYGMECLFVTEAMANLYVKAFLPQHFTANRRVAGNVQLRSTSFRINFYHRIINLHVCIRGFSTQSTAHIADKLAVNILFETNVIDQNILGILPQSKKVVSCSSKPVSIRSPKATTANFHVSKITVSK